MAVSKPNVASKCSLESSRRDLHSALLWWQNVARFRLDRHRPLQENTRLAAFFNIYQTIKLKCLEMWQDFCKKYNNNNVCKKQFCKHLQNSANFRKIEIFKMILKIFVKFGNVLTIFRKKMCFQICATECIVEISATAFKRIFTCKLFFADCASFAKSPLAKFHRYQC